MVTCYTCHHARDVPSTTIALDALYSTPNMEKDDIVKADPIAAPRDRRFWTNTSRRWAGSRS